MGAAIHPFESLRTPQNTLVEDNIGAKAGFVFPVDLP